MASFDELMKRIEGYNATIGHDLEWEKLRDRILDCKEEEDIVQVYSDVKEYLKSSAPDAEKEKLKGYIECLLIKLDAVLPEGYAENE